MGAIVAVLHKEGHDATEMAVESLSVMKTRHTEAYGIASPTTIKIERNAAGIQGQKLGSHLIIGYAFSRILCEDKPQPIGLEHGTLVFDGRIYPPPKRMSDAESIADMIFHNPSRIAKTIRETEGDFAFVVAEQNRLMAGRDSIGIRPLYYGENEIFVALASERKALWKIGVEKTDTFPPGHIASIDRRGLRFKPVRTLSFSEARRTTMKNAAEELGTLLRHSIEERVSGLKEVAAAFSGGLDSSMIAFLAKQLGISVHLVHVSLEDQPETAYAKKMAAELDMPLHVYTFDENDLEEAIPEVIRLVEEPDPMKICIGIPMYWVAEKTTDLGYRIVLAGQGADELLLGYKRYVDYYLLHGGEKTRRRGFDDIVRIHDTNLERDYKISNFHNVELRLPFAAYEMAEFAISLPTELKIEPQRSGLRKLVLRQIGENIGLPKSIVNKPKRAVQYSTGVEKSVRRIAKRERLTVKEYVRRKFEEVTEMM